jgi:hypothetical protein
MAHLSATEAARLAELEKKSTSERTQAELGEMTTLQNKKTA